MGLDFTIYMAKNNPPDEPPNPYMDPPPAGMHWHQVAYWRKHYSLATAMFPEAGSPDWRQVTVEDIDRTLTAMETGAEWFEPGDAFRLVEERMRARNITAAALRIARGHITEGRTLLMEVLQ